MSDKPLAYSTPAPGSDAFIQAMRAAEAAFDQQVCLRTLALLRADGAATRPPPPLSTVLPTIDSLYQASLAAISQVNEKCIPEAP